MWAFNHTHTHTQKSNSHTTGLHDLIPKTLGDWMQIDVNRTIDHFPIHFGLLFRNKSECWAFVMN